MYGLPAMKNNRVADNEDLMFMHLLHPKLNSHIIANIFLNSNFHFHAKWISLYFFCTWQFWYQGWWKPLKYGRQIVNIKINIDLFMSFFTNGVQQNCVLFQTLHTRFHLKTFKLLKQHKSQEENHPRGFKHLYFHGASGLLYS